MRTVMNKNIHVTNSPNDITLGECPPPAADLRRRLAAVRRSMNEEVKSLDAMVELNYYNIIAFA